MKISKRSLLIMISLMLALTTAALGTVAYMTDQDTVTNNFTVGNVDIFVDEENVDKDPKPDGTIPDRDQDNDYKLVPGGVYKKDPTLTVKAGSEACYVRMRVQMNCYAALNAITGKTGYDLLNTFVTINSDWQAYGNPVVNPGTNVISYEFRYKPVTPGETEIVNAGAANKTLQALFNTFSVPVTFTGNDLSKLSGFKMQVFGDAVQTEAFANAEKAWEAFDWQNFGKTPSALVIPEQSEITEEANEESSNTAVTTDPVVEDNDNAGEAGEESPAETTDNADGE